MARLEDTGERMIPTRDGEVSVVFARHKFAYDFAKQFVEGKDVVDVGCGTGYGCKILAEKAHYVFGLDYDAYAVEYCRENFSGPNIDYRQADASRLELDRSFDVAVSFQVIEHMRDADDFVDRLKNVVIPGGTILISTPNVRTRAIDGEGNPFHFSEMNYDQFRDIMNAKFGDAEIIGVSNARPNRLRGLLQKLPVYRLGRYLKRGSRLKRAAAKTLDLTSFRIIRENVAEDAIDLLAVCRPV